METLEWKRKRRRSTVLTILAGDGCHRVLKDALGEMVDIFLTQARITLDLRAEVRHVL